MLTRTFSLDMVPGGVPLHIHVSQYDSDEEIILHLFSSQGTLSVPSSGVSAKIRGTKVDGNGIDNVCTFSFTDDVPTVTVKLTQQMTAVVGKNPFEIVLTAVDDTSGEGYELPSATFYLIVKKAALDYETVGSNSDIAEIADVMAKADRLISSAQTIEKAAAEIKAGGFAGQDDLNALQSDVSNIEETVENLKTAVGNKVQGGYLSNNALFLVTDDYGSLGPFTGMMDVAKEQGKEADCRIISERLGIPVIPFVASDRKKYDSFYELLKKGDKEGGIISPHMLEQLYEKEFGGQYKEIISHLPEDGISVYGKSWLFAKLAEGDTAAMKLVKDSVSAEDFGTIRETLDQIENGASRTGNCKFRWIDSLLDGAITRADAEKKKNSFDRIAFSKRWGKPLAIVIVLAGLLVSIILGLPLMAIGQYLPLIGQPLSGWMTSLGVHPLLVSLICDAILTGFSFTVMMCGFIFGSTFVFGLMEDIGYMARISYVFDGTMRKIGLHGKAIMPFLVSFGCNIAGASGSRVLDTWGQRMMTIALSWVVPCGSTWGVVGLVSTAFFGPVGAVAVIVALFAVSFIHLRITAKIYGKKLLGAEDRTGLIMELPPYHKLHWGNVFRTSLIRMWEAFKRAIGIITIVAVILCLLSYSASGDPSQSLLYRFGSFIEPVTMFFGLRWQTFIAWVASWMGKEGSLGVLASVFGNGNVMTAIATQKVATTNSAAVGSALAAALTKPEALAFIFAFYFNMPCVMSLSSAVHETHSLRWPLRIALYYICMSLILACIVYHVTVLFM